MITPTLPDIIGLLGAGMIILAYFLNQSRVLRSEDIRYPLINLIGALLITYSLFFTFNLASFVIEMFWIAISLMGIYKAMRERARTRAKRT